MQFGLHYSTSMNGNRVIAPLQIHSYTSPWAHAHPSSTSTICCCSHRSEATIEWLDFTCHLWFMLMVYVLGFLTKQGFEEIYVQNSCTQTLRHGHPGVQRVFFHVDCKCASSAAVTDFLAIFNPWGILLFGITRGVIFFQSAGTESVTVILCFSCHCDKYWSWSFALVVLSVSLSIWGVICMLHLSWDIIMLLVQVNCVVLLILQCNLSEAFGLMSFFDQDLTLYET